MVTQKRKTVPKHIRMQVYKKYNGRCAYCGCELEYKDMQVDHINSVYWHNGQSSIENYNPACRMCNFYKSAYTVEKFRENIQTLHDRLDKNFIYRLAKKYGVVKENTDRILFYFEKGDVNGTDNMDKGGVE